MAKRLFSIPEAAAYLDRTIWGMRELIWKGVIPVVKSDRRIFLDLNDLNDFIEKNKTTYI